ncbi:MAG: transporter [Tardiphaga sp.]|uniref:ABC transporter substrate-binding protein n=1 Tax=Tardiphaga sp. TaxID=1926292 RepID=UPI0026032C0A|nr:ABC transporter substrate-binding protein [Tardiphaga sp.]MDB5503788.1 transporter [Tardiphaga sp.]
MTKAAIRVVLIACISAAALAPVRAQDVTPLKIGLILPYKGVWAAPVENIDRGFRVALAEFGNKTAGRPVEVVRADDELTPNVAVQKFNKLVQFDKVDVIGGGVSSNVAIALSELADRAKKPVVMTNAHADEITGKLCSPYVARTSFSANAFQYGAGKYWAQKGVKKVVTMTADYSAGHSFMDAFKRGFEDGGGQVVQQIWTPFQKTRDWSAALGQAGASGAEFIYAFYSGSEAVQVVKQHADFGMREKVPLIGDQWLFDEVGWPALGDLVIGGKFVASYLPGAQNEANRKFVAAYRQMFNEDPDVNAALGYDNGKTIMLTLEKLGGKMPDDTAGFMTALRTVNFDAPRGKIRFNAQNSAQLEKEYLVEIVKGADGKPDRRQLDEFSGAEDLPGCTKSF